MWLVGIELECLQRTRAKKRVVRNVFNEEMGILNHLVQQHINLQKESEVFTL
jgi:hypothetical protein